MIKLSFPTHITESLYNLLTSIKYLRTSSYSREGKEIARFSYRTNFSLKLDYKTLLRLVDIENQIGIKDLVLSRFINYMQEGDYIDWTSKVGISPAKILLLSVTDGHIEFEEGKVQLKAGEAIVFPITKKYKVDPVSKPQIGMVWLIRDSFDDYQKLNGVSITKM